MDFEIDDPPQKIIQIKEYEEKIALINVKVKNDLLAVEQKFNLLREDQLKKRKSIISKIPNFWSVVFENHPTVRALFDPELLRSLRDFELVFANNLRGSYSLNFHFHDNPYFENKVLTKYYDFEDDEFETCLIIPIEWKSETLRQSKESPGISGIKKDFFAWYNDYNIDHGNLITKIMKQELWSDPLRFYLDEDEQKK